MSMFRRWLWDGARVQLSLVPIYISDDTFPFTPLQENYQVTQKDNEVFQQPLEGGLAFSCLDMTGAGFYFNVAFQLTADEYRQFWTYHDEFLNYGVNSFFMLLSLNSNTPAVAEVQILPGSIRTTSYRNGCWRLEFQVEMLPTAIDDAVNQDIIDEFE